MLYTHEFKKENFHGHAVIKVPSFKERMSKLKEAGIKVSSKGEFESDPLQMLDKCIDLVKESVVSFEVVCGDQKVNDLEQLSYYREYQEFALEVGVLLISGIPLGESSRAQS
jgi:hypothetical protein